MSFEVLAFVAWRVLHRWAVPTQLAGVCDAGPVHISSPVALTSQQQRRCITWRQIVQTRSGRGTASKQRLMWKSDSERRSRL
jgi:hypothetical protein